MKKIILTFLLFIFTITAQENIKPVLFSLNVKDLNKSVEWYKKNLKFEVDTLINVSEYDIKIGLLKKNPFYLELIQNKESISEPEIKLPEGIRVINGYSKIGFATDNLNGVYQRIKMNGGEIFNEISDGQLFEGKFFIAKDNDGNYLQFFSSTGTGSNKLSFSLKPFIISKFVSDLKSAVEWYKQNLGFTVTEQFEIPANNLKLAFIEKNGFNIELVETGNSIAKDKISLKSPNQKILGINKIGFLIDNIQNTYSKMKFLETPIFIGLTEDNLNIAAKFFIIEDSNKDYIQFFE